MRDRRSLTALALPSLLVAGLLAGGTVARPEVVPVAASPVDLVPVVTQVGDPAPLGVSRHDVVVHNASGTAATARVSVAVSGSSLAPFGTEGVEGLGWTCGYQFEITCTTDADVPAGGALPAIRVTQSQGSGSRATTGVYARVASADDTEPQYDRASSLSGISAVAGPDLAVAVRSEGRAVIGGTATFVVDVGSVGGRAYSGQVPLEFPNDGAFSDRVEVSGDGWSCALLSGTPSCSRNEALLLPGAVLPPLTAVARVPSDGTAVAVTARIRDDFAPSDAFAQNNGGTAVLPVSRAGEVDLAVSASSNGTADQAAIVVRNLGTAVAPPGTRVAVGRPAPDPGPGWTCAETCVSALPVAPGASLPPLVVPAGYLDARTLVRAALTGASADGGGNDVAQARVAAPTPGSPLRTEVVGCPTSSSRASLSSPGSCWGSPPHPGGRRRAPTSTLRRPRPPSDCSDRCWSRP